MNVIRFKAKEVEYNEAIDGEIVQVSFDEDPNQDLFNKIGKSPGSAGETVKV